MRTISIVIIAIIVFLHSVQGQDSLRGGSGGFMIGFKSFDVDSYQFFVPNDGPIINDNILQIGGEGYGIVNNWIIGGGGYWNIGDSDIQNDIEYQIRGGGGYLNAGYILHDSKEIILFPLLGIGLEATGLNRKIKLDIDFERGSFLETTYIYFSPFIDLGAGIDWFPGNKGFKLGLRTGYTLSFNKDGKWRHYGGEFEGPDLPRNDLNGLYFRITIGGGHFSNQSNKL